MMKVFVSSDEDLNQLFSEAADELVAAFEYSPEKAESLLKSYYALFTSSEHCRSLGIPLQDDEFFFHEDAGGVALRAHYYLGLGGDPSPRAYIEWRANQRVAGSGL